MNPLARGILFAPSCLYRGAVALRNRYYDRSAAVRAVSVPVVSVGNLTLGGTGKTPIVSWLALQFGSMGRRPAIVSRGYGGTAGRGPVFVSRGQGPVCDARRVGDEPVQLAARLPGVRVVVGSDRWAGAAAAAADGADVVILDDGFQHRRLARDLDIVLLDASDPFGGGHLIPAGRLREPLHALRRAQVVLITRARSDATYPRIESVVRRYRPEATILFAAHTAVGFLDTRGREMPPPARAVAFCGIGNPRSFRTDVERFGTVVVSFQAFRDHHVYTRAEIERLQQTARSGDAVLVTTEKDLVRIAADNHPIDPSSLLALRIEAAIRHPDPLVHILRRLAAPGEP